MKLPSNTAPLVLALAVLSASAEAATKDSSSNKTYPAPIERKHARKTSLRKGGRRAQGAQQRAIICEAQGGVGQSGQVATAPAYDQCYLSGCDRQTFGCTTSSQCAPGACCMPTNIHGSYCVEVEPLYGLNKYIAPKCLCREGKPSDAGLGDAVIDTNTGDVTVIGGGDGDNNSQGQQQQAQPASPTDPAAPAQTTPTTPTTPTRPVVSTPMSCDGCTINGLCMPAGSVWLLEDNCSRCTCINSSGMGDYRCKGCRVEDKPAPTEEEEEKPAVTPARPVVIKPITDITDSDDMMEESEQSEVVESAVPPPMGPGIPAKQPEPEPQPEPQPEPEEEEEIVLLDEPEPVRPTVIAKPNPDNIANGGGTNAASASSHTGTGGFGVESTTPYGDGKVVCQASGGVANRGSIPTITNYEDCYGGKCGATGMCERSSQCAGGACCMPTRFGSYCTDVTYLVTTYNKFAAPWCKCDLAENRAGDFGFVAGGAQKLGGSGGGEANFEPEPYNELQEEMKILNQPLEDPHANYNRVVPGSVTNPGDELLQAELKIVNGPLLDPNGDD